VGGGGKSFSSGGESGGGEGSGKRVSEGGVVCSG